MAIPRLIHQACLSMDLPEILQENVNRLRVQNPGWYHRLYDDTAAEAFIIKHYDATMLRDYLSIDSCYGAARADLFRYLVVYRLGGVYLDLKSSFLHPIDTVLHDDDSFIISQWQNVGGGPHDGYGLHASLAQVPGGEFQQWHVIATSGHPFLKRVIDHVVAGIHRYRARKATVGWNGVLNLTGPIAYTQAIAPVLQEHPHRRIASEQSLGLQFSVLPAASHQQLSKKHYSRSSTPIIKRVWPLSIYDKFYVTFDRAFKKVMTKRYTPTSSDPSHRHHAIE